MLIRLSPDPASEVLGTGYSRFNWEDRICGLCKIDDASKFQLLAVSAVRPGRGGFRDFVAELKQTFACIIMWHVENPFLPEVLQRYGFRPWSERLCFQGEWELCEGWRWDR